MNIKTLGVTWVVGFLLLAQALAGDALETTAQNMVARQVAGWNAMDADAWAADFTEDSEFINIIGMRFVNRQQNVDRHAHLYTTIFKDSTLSGDVLAVKQLTDDVALVETRFILRGHSANPPGVQNTKPGELHTHIKLVLQKFGTDWRIVAAQNTALAPLPSSP